MAEKKPGFFGRLFGKKEEPEAPAPAEEHQVEAALGEPEEAALPDAASAEGLSPSEIEEPLQPETVTEVVAEVLEPGPDSEAEQVLEPIAEPQPAPEPQPEPQEEAKPKKGWFARLKDGLTRSSTQLGSSITSIFTKKKLDQAMLDDLEDALLQADLGLETAMAITDALAEDRFDKDIEPDEVRAVLAREVEKVLAPVAMPLDVSTAKPFVILTVGVNGSGKTTTIGKLASKFRAEGRSVMIAAGDTFRAAAIEQLKVWGERTGAPVIAKDQGSDASGLAYDALKSATEEGRDILLIDTAGRLQNKSELMAELEKIVRVIKKLDETAPHAVLLVLDATTGQNALQQVEIFGKTAGVTGLVMTKLDGTAKGGILVAISAKYKIPVHFIGVGEGIDDLQPFDAGEFGAAIAGAAEGMTEA